ncbi:MAG: ABC transporter ATP-binding protein [Deltaproteobacteria bacterium]|nr:ABC transporter ATP-binding protein [Deltaproteobacteria bacterium]
MALLDVKDLVVHYGKINALKGVSLRLEQGDFVALIGANGAGKTTLLCAISGVVHATSGTVSFRGKSIFNHASEAIVRSGISHVPEGRKIFSELSVEENLYAGAYIISDKARVKDLLERSYQLFPRLAERRKKEGGTLSGGEQQMLAIARGLMSDPDILFLDEPSLGIAPILVDKIFEFIVQINAMGKTILMIEQNANLALQVARYGYVMETGKITHEAACAELREDDAIRRAYLGVTGATT